MELKGVHFLLTYRCDLECDHCFVWGSPKAKGVFTIKQIKNVLSETKKLETVSYIAIEGGEPFLYYPIMVKTAEEASALGFRVEILSNCYWATTPEDAIEWLAPVAKAKGAIGVSSDFYHGDDWATNEAKNAIIAAKALNLKVGINTVKNPTAELPNPPAEIEGVKIGALWEIMYRGRAATKLIEKANKKPWREFTKCPYENFAKQERVHIDPFGYVHACQGIAVGNAWQKPFSKIIQEYSPYENPILEPLVSGGPVALIEKFSLPHDEAYADACHLCYAARIMLRNKYPEVLTPDQMYGELE
ncbi:radical SAM protein [Candidatus Bathyarchaeota archaeon]|nr:radical SAM protein [Candidatus Bathyarchaeota archaeon]